MEVCESKVHLRSSIMLLLSSQYCSCVVWGYFDLKVGILLGMWVLALVQ
jgi:hypothetical protein